MSPERGIKSLPRRQAGQLKLNFISTAVQKYDLAMLVDVEAVGDSLLSLPITAECIVPAIKPSTFEIDYGDAFVRYTYEQTIKIVLTVAPARQVRGGRAPPMLKAIGEFEPSPPTEIPAKGEIDVKVKFTAGRLGQMCLPMYVRIVGLLEPAFTVELNANAIGPNVHDRRRRRIDWGKAMVLTDVDARAHADQRLAHACATTRACCARATRPSPSARPRGRSRRARCASSAARRTCDDAVKLDQRPHPADRATRRRSSVPLSVDGRRRDDHRQRHARRRSTSARTSRRASSATSSSSRTSAGSRSSSRGPT